MLISDYPRDRDRDHLATIATVIDLARDEHPEVARLALGAFACALEDGGARMLERAYDLASEAENEYLAELVDLALSQAEKAAVA